jgi:hypothetical protein
MGRDAAFPVLAVAVLALACGGCGQTEGRTVSAPAAAAPEGGAQVTSQACSSSSTAGAPAQPARCDYVLSDGRRYRCPGGRFGSSTPTPAVLARTAGCFALAPLASATPAPAAVAAVSRSRTCLRAAGFTVTGGATSLQGNGADGELTIRAGAGRALIGFYASARDAGLAEHALRASGQVSGEALERRGAQIVAWIRTPESRTRSSSRACLPG